MVRRVESSGPSLAVWSGRPAQASVPAGDEGYAAWDALTQSVLLDGESCGGLVRPGFTRCGGSKGCATCDDSDGFALDLEAVSTYERPPASGWSLSTGLPCDPDDAAAPPWSGALGVPSEEEWASWWGDCWPAGPIGPGVEAGCDLDAAWTEAISFCYWQCVLTSAAPEECDIADNVAYAYISADCTVVDAKCYDVSHGGGSVWLAYTAGHLTGYSDYGALTVVDAHQQGSAMGGTHVATVWYTDGSIVVYYDGSVSGSGGGTPNEAETLEDILKDYIDSLDEDQLDLFDSLLEELGHTWLEPEQLEGLHEDCLSGEVSGTLSQVAGLMTGGDVSMLCTALVMIYEDVDLDEVFDGSDPAESESQFKDDPFDDSDDCPPFVLC